MENMMKRAISAVMALVLVLGMLPGVPMFAGAEEVETQPETMAVETTEAVTVSEETEAPETTAAPETEAPETVPETTVAEETLPQETEPEVTLPAETVAEETVPEETQVEETVPQETVVEETVPGETVPEVSEDAADANDTIVLAKKIEISASKDRTYLGDDVKLTAVFTPAETTETEVLWVVDEGSVNETVLQKGYLRAVDAGTVVVHAEAIDGSGIVSEPIEVEFVYYKMEINETAIPEENVYEGDYVLQSGASMPLSVKYMTWLENEDEAKVELPLHTPELTWTLAEGCDKYASLSGSGKEVTLTAKLVTEYQTVTVKVMDSAIGWEDTISIRLYPNSYKVYITQTVDETGSSVEQDVTNGIIILDLASLPADEDARIVLQAGIWPVEGDEKLVWSSSDTLVQLEDPDEEDDWNNEMVLLVDKRSGETTVTVRGTEHPDVSATVIIRRVRYLQEIAPTKATAQVPVDGLVEGKSVTLQAIAYEDREIVDNKLLKWEIAEGDEAYATISDQGVLKAKDVELGKVITVKCSVVREDGKEPAGFELYIPIIPKATAVEIYADTFIDEDSGPRMLQPGEVLNGKTITVDTEFYKNNPAVPAFLVKPYAEEYSGTGDPVGVKQEVAWKSSNPAVAAFDPLTDELIWKGKNGTTTITATAKDGSGKSASVKLQFGAKLRELTIEGTEDMFLRSGSSWTFDLTYAPENATNKAVTWSVYKVNSYGELEDASAVATINGNGRLTAKTVYDNHQVVVFAASKEDPSVFAFFEVTIRPKKDYALTLLDEDGNCVTKGTILLDVGESTSLEAVFVGEEVGKYYDAGAEWKSSAKTVAYAEDGYVEALKVGSSTITATSSDGQKATVTIKVVSKVDYIEVYEKKGAYVLASGKSMTLKADVYDFDTATENNLKGRPNVSKVNWFIEGDGGLYATVNSSGKVTAIKGYDGECKTIGVYAVATDGSGTVSDPYYIDIYPAVEAMRIDFSETAQTTGTYTHYLAYSGETIGTVTAVTFPTNACSEVSWKSSNTKIAEVDENGSVTAHAAGSVTITATALDGTNKKATMKLTIISKAVGMEFNNDANEYYSDTYFTIAGGKNLALKPVFYGVDGKKINVPVEWEISTLVDSYGTAFVRKFSKGALNTVQVTQPKYTEVTLYIPADYVLDDMERIERNGKEYAFVKVLVGVFPATTSLEITENDKVITEALWRRVGCAPFELGVKTNEYAVQGWVWKSSNEKIARVDPYSGEVYSTGKAGIVTITATSRDGTGKKDSIRITFAN